LRRQASFAAGHQAETDAALAGVAGTLQGCIIKESMKAYVYVSMKKSVLDPQGKTIQGALTKMGYKGVADVRQGKYFELSLDGSLDREAARLEVERMASEVLTNPVIEEFRYTFED
jgi:phosphoribosylformylglycinamidine synthase subunit PurS